MNIEDRIRKAAKELGLDKGPISKEDTVQILKKAGIPIKEESK